MVALDKSMPSCGSDGTLLLGGAAESADIATVGVDYFQISLCLDNSLSLGKCCRHFFGLLLALIAVGRECIREQTSLPVDRLGLDSSRSGALSIYSCCRAPSIPPGGWASSNRACHPGRRNRPSGRGGCLRSSSTATA